MSVAFRGVRRARQVRKALVPWRFGRRRDQRRPSVEPVAHTLLSRVLISSDDPPFPAIVPSPCSMKTPISGSARPPRCLACLSRRSVAGRPTAAACGRRARRRPATDRRSTRSPAARRAPPGTADRPIVAQSARNRFAGHRHPDRGRPRRRRRRDHRRAAPPRQPHDGRGGRGAWACSRRRGHRRREGHQRHRRDPVRPRRRAREIDGRRSLLVVPSPGSSPPARAAARRRRPASARRRPPPRPAPAPRPRRAAA